MTVLAVNSSGTATILLLKGRSVHATFKGCLNLTSTWRPICNIRKGSVRTKILKVQDHCMV